MGKRPWPPVRTRLAVLQGRWQHFAPLRYVVPRNSRILKCNERRGRSGIGQIQPGQCQEPAAGFADPGRHRSDRVTEPIEDHVEDHFVARPISNYTVAVLESARNTTLSVAKRRKY